MVVCSIASGLSFGSTAKGVIATLCFFRFWLGFGIGGDYPLSATIMSEYANKKTRGAFIAAVFAMQGFGILTGAIVAIIVSAGFKNKYDVPPYNVDRAGSTVPQADYVWRIILMFGALPASLTYYMRMKMPETARYTALVARNAKQAAADMSKVLNVKIQEDVERAQRLVTDQASTFGLFSKEFARRHGIHLLATTTTWFFLDIAFYSQNLFQKDIFSRNGWIPKAATMNAIEEVFRIARAQTLIALCGTVPGYWFTIAFIEVLGRYWIQIMGFFMMTVFMLTLAIPYNHWTHNNVGFVVLYGFTFFFANFGPNSTTFIVPAEIFPARLRSTCHGISAATGKAGAIVGAFGFLYAAQDKDPAKRDKGYPAGIGIRNASLRRRRDRKSAQLLRQILCSQKMEGRGVVEGGEVAGEGLGAPADRCDEGGEGVQRGGGGGGGATNGGGRGGVVVLVMRGGHVEDGDKLHESEVVWGLIKNF